MAQSTKQALAATLKQLLEKKSLDDITVKEIVESCEVNRQTFYYHFQDIYDLLGWFLEQEAKQALAGKYSAADWHQGLLNAFYYVQDNLKLIFHIFGSGGQALLAEHLNEMSQQIMYRVVESSCQDLEIAEHDKHFIARFYKLAFAGLLLEWITGGMAEDPVDIVNQVSNLLEGEFRRAAERFAVQKPKQPTNEAAAG